MYGKAVREQILGWVSTDIYMLLYVFCRLEINLGEERKMLLYCYGPFNYV